MIAFLSAAALANPQIKDVRDSLIPAVPRLAVEGGQNGGISVVGWDQPEIRVRAIVEASAPSEAQAREIAQQVRVSSSGGTVSATGPESSGRTWWSVSYEISAPRATALALTATNGGLDVTGMDADIGLRTTNGGIALEDVGGSVHGETTNGAVSLVLSGAGWSGAGVDLRTVNGGIAIEAPRTYAATLQLSTVHGGVAIPREPRPAGPPIRISTTNGGIEVTDR